MSYQRSYDEGYADGMVRYRDERDRAIFAKEQAWDQRNYYQQKCERYERLMNGITAAIQSMGFEEDIEEEEAGNEQ